MLSSTTITITSPAMADQSPAPSVAPSATRTARPNVRHHRYCNTNRFPHANMVGSLTCNCMFRTKHKKWCLFRQHHKSSRSYFGSMGNAKFYDRYVAGSTLQTRHGHNESRKFKRQKTDHLETGAMEILMLIGPSNTACNCRTSLPCGGLICNTCIEPIKGYTECGCQDCHYCFYCKKCRSVHPIAELSEQYQDDRTNQSWKWERLRHMEKMRRGRIEKTRLKNQYRRAAE